MRARLTRFAALFVLTGALVILAEDPPATRKTEPATSATVRVVIEPAKEPNHLAETLKAIAELISAIAWPALVAAVLISQRTRLADLVTAIVEMASKSKRLKFGDVIEIELDRSAAEAQHRSELTREVPLGDIQAATRVNRNLTPEDLPMVRARMIEFAREYETTRASMPPGKGRRHAMEAIAAKIRTLALAASPLLPEFAGSQSAGVRLAATVILQLTPEINYVPWLVERMRQEQPFLFFNAALALRAAVRSFGQADSGTLESTLRQALDIVKSYAGGSPDPSTIEVLEAALRELSAPTPP